MPAYENHGIAIGGMYDRQMMSASLGTVYFTKEPNHEFIDFSPSGSPARETVETVAYNWVDLDLPAPHRGVWVFEPEIGRNETSRAAAIRLLVAAYRESVK